MKSLSNNATYLSVILINVAIGAFFFGLASFAIFVQGRDSNWFWAALFLTWLCQQNLPFWTKSDERHE